jgi:hypothetical protein
MQAPSAAADVPESAGGTEFDAPRPTAWWRRLWGAPLGVHALVLLVILVALIPVARFDASFSSDEGAGILQAQRLAKGESWLQPNDLPSLDPDGKAFFITLSEGGPDAFATYAKHPAYAWLLAGADRVGGAFTMTLLSVVATTLAAVAAALIARRWDPKLDRWALWVLGIGSPLLFDSQVVLAHSIGAACAGFAALLIFSTVARKNWLAVIGAAAFLATCSFFRSEGLLFGLAVSASVGFVGLRRRRPDLIVTAVVLVAASGATTFIDRFWVGHILGRGTVPLNTVGDGFLGGRLSSAATTFILPGATWPDYAVYGLSAMLIALVATSLVARRPPVPAAMLRLGCAVVVAGALLPLLATPDTINSLLITCPILTAGWFLLGRRDLPGLERPIAVATCGLYVLAVLATQYSEGGAAEWGARFLAIMLPVAIPIALVALKRTAATLPRPDRRWAGAALAVATLSMAIISITSLRYYRGVTAAWLEQVEQAQAQTDGPDLGNGDRRPIVVTTWEGLGRMTWPLDTPPRGLFIPAGTLPAYAKSLHDHGVTEFVFATNDPRTDLPMFDGLYEPVASFPAGRSSPAPVSVMRAE